jgi:Outer membrane protein beta-barrel domain
MIMKRILLMCIIACATMTTTAQTDSTAKKQQGDTIRIGGMVIIRKGGDEKGVDMGRGPRVRDRKYHKPSAVSTNWGIVDIGFSNYDDQTNYLSAAAQSYAPGGNASWFNLRNGKSRNVNVWFFMQRIRVIKNAVNLKYGFGLELNNYHYKQNIRYDANPPAVANAPIVSLDNTPGRTYSKNKLAANYLTVPMMINFNFTPNRSDPFGFSVGASAGWLYGSHNKTKTSDEGKEKARDDFDLREFKISYIAELNLGEIKLYGSLATQSMYKRGLDITPYNIGIRISSFD